METKLREGTVILMKVHRVISNKVMCLSCSDEIESTRDWEFVTCKCGDVSVDGGTGYESRRVYKPGAIWKELSKTEWLELEPGPMEASISAEERESAEVFSTQQLTESEREVIAEFSAGFADALNSRRALLSVRREMGTRPRYMDLVRWFVTPNIYLEKVRPLEVWKTNRALVIRAARLSSLKTSLS